MATHQVEMISTQSRTRAKWAALPHKLSSTRNNLNPKRWGMGRFAWSSTRPERFIADVISTDKYTTEECELKRERERNERRECCSIGGNLRARVQRRGSDKIIDGRFEAAFLETRTRRNDGFEGRLDTSDLDSLIA